MKNSLLLCLLFLCRQAIAQLPADKESHHKVIFENNSIRVLEGLVPPHDTTPAHVHAANGVVVFLSASRFFIQPVGGQPALSTVNPGDVKYVNYGDKPVNHLVWAEGDTALHFFVVELKRRMPIRDFCTLADVPGIKFLWQQPLVGAYALSPDGKTPTRIPKTDCAYLLIAIAGSGKVTAARKTDVLRGNQFQFFEPQTEVLLEGSGRFVLLACPLR